MADIVIKGVDIPEGDLEYVSILVYGDGRVYMRKAGAACSQRLQDLAVTLPEGLEKLGDTIDAIAQKVYAALDALDRGTNNDWARTALEEANQVLDAYYKKEVYANG